MTTRRMAQSTNQISTMSGIVAIVSLALCLQLSLCDTSSNTTTTISELNVRRNEVSDYADATTASSAKKQKPLYSTGNELWDNLIRDCLKKPSFSCIQKNVYTYLDGTLNLNDVNVTSKVQLTRNQLVYELPETPNDEENEIYFEGRGEFSIAKRLINFLHAARFHRDCSLLTVFSGQVIRFPHERSIFGACFVCEHLGTVLPRKHSRNFIKSQPN